MSQIQVCIDPIVPEDRRIEAARTAIEENPSNLPLSRVRPRLGVEPITPLELALVTAKKWKNGRELRVHFLDGHPDVQTKVEQYAHQWSQFANVTFKFGYDPSAEIRISFEREGSWSYLGTDALEILRPQPTMNFGWLTPSSSDDEYSRVVIHEFGHALGCIHEHQNPDAGIPWNKEAVYAYYARLGWGRQQVDNNLFRRYDRNLTNFSAYDKTSIMHYPIRQEHTIGNFEVGWNRQLSAMDKEFIGLMYPQVDKQPTKITVDDPPIAAAIGKHGEEDLFEFTVSSQGRHTIETGGSTDIVMTLLGPGNQTNQIAEDDDSGRGFNAKIVRDLESGPYYARIRHYWPTGTGNYHISVRAG